MDVFPTRLPDVALIAPRVFPAPRGFCMETWQAERYRKAGIPGPKHVYVHPIVTLIFADHRQAPAAIPLVLITALGDQKP